MILPGEALTARGKVILLPFLELEKAQLCIISMYKDHLQLNNRKVVDGKAFPLVPDCGYFNTDWGQLLKDGSVCLMKNQWTLLIV